jgi:hypothetical protein
MSTSHMFLEGQDNMTFCSVTLNLGTELSLSSANLKELSPLQNSVKL